MARLHLFFPENDLALAANDGNYTPPRAAVDLRVAGEPLAMWFGKDGDKFVTQGVPAAWYDAIVEAFKMNVKVFDGETTTLRPLPWGWSLASRRYYEQMGFAESVLPGKERIERMRQLSHRRTSAELASQLFDLFGDRVGIPAVEANNAESILKHVHALGRAMIKLPWSSSGRGIVDTNTLSDEEIERRAMGTVRRQGSVMIEPFYDNPTNFAYLYKMKAGEVQFKGYSLFEVDSHHTYSGNIVAGDAKLEEMIAAHVDVDLLCSVRDAIALILKNIIGRDYDGVLGVDMMIADARLAVAEINLRMTMGHVAHALAERYVADGAIGKYTIEPRIGNECFMPGDCSIVNGKIESGMLDLVPADRRIRFILAVK